MISFIAASVAVVVAALIGREYLARKANLNKPTVLQHVSDSMKADIDRKRIAVEKGRAEFGKANPAVQFVLGAILSVFFFAAAYASYQTYTWMFRGFGQEPKEAMIYAVIPFTLVFVFAWIVKMLFWDLAQDLLGYKKAENKFGRTVAGIVTVILFTGVVLQLAPFAGARSEYTIGAAVVTAQEDLDTVTAECETTPAPGCDADIAAAQTKLDAAKHRLDEGRKSDRILATLVPIGEVVTALGLFMMIEVLAMVAIPLMRLRSAEKKQRKLNKTIVAASTVVPSVAVTGVDVTDRPALEAPVEF